MSKDKCHDLKNLQYKTLLDKKSKLDIKNPDQAIDNINNIEKLLEKEKKLHNKNNWSKLNKTQKLRYLNNYVDNYTNHDLTLNEKLEFKKYLINMINKKQLQKKTDINYNTVDDKIIDIPVVVFNKESRTFRQYRSEKKSSTSSSLSRLKITRKNK
jgi:hypothetical protein